MSQITAANAGDLKVLCTYDTGQYTGFNSGLLEVEGALIFTTAFDIFSINPNDCSQNWRIHEDYQPATPQLVSRGAAYLDGSLFRGTQDGASSPMISKPANGFGKRSSATRRRGKRVCRADCMERSCFHRQRRGDIKGVKGRMYAIDAKTGKIVWEFYLVPRSAGDVERGRRANRRSTVPPGRRRPARL